MLVPAAEIGRPCRSACARRSVRWSGVVQACGPSAGRSASSGTRSRRERKCADRFGSPFAVLLLEHRPLRRGGPVGPGAARGGRDRARHRHHGLARAGRRAGDASFRIPRGKAALKVMRAVQREIDRRVGDSAAVSISVHGHGDRPEADGADLPAVDRLIESFVEPPARPARDAAKRCLDIIGSLALLLLFSPVLLGVFAAVRTTSPGPVLFRQVRVGRRRESFTMLKFRTMYVDAGHGHSPAVRELVHQLERTAAPHRHRGVQAHERPAHHPGRTLPPQDQPRRAAAVLERAAGRHVARRPAAAAALRGRAVQGLAPPPRARRQARRDRARGRSTAAAARPSTKWCASTSGMPGRTRCGPTSKSWPRHRAPCSLEREPPDGSPILPLRLT